VGGARSVVDVDGVATVEAGEVIDVTMINGIEVNVVKIPDVVLPAANCF
jgi:hypothetical protein